jgi:hypothetical protein
MANSLSGVWRLKADPTIHILIERDYKKKDSVNFFYFMCRLCGGGTITKLELQDKYERV